MHSIRVNRRSVGISFSSRGEAEVLVWAPNAKQLALEIRATEKIQLTRDDYGYWSCITSLLQPGDNYLFEIDGIDYYSDPASLSQPVGVKGPSRVVNVHAHQWNDVEWKNHLLKDYILYELHTGTFNANSTFAGIEEKLPYLVELGITAIEIMPVAQFSGKRNWGYDGVFPFAVHESYGGPEGLQRLVDACHQHGIAVVLDVVYNHLGPEGNMLDKFGNYFTEKYKTPWGNAINFDDAGCDAVRHYFIENALMWFRDFHIDALRLDAVHAIKDLSPVHFLEELRLNVEALKEETGRVHYLIAECDLNDNRFITPVEEGGYGMDAQWIDEFHHALRVTAGNDRSGYYEDFNGIIHLAKAVSNAYVYDGIYSAHRGKVFGTSAERAIGSNFITFSQNHDQVGNRMLGERTSTLVSAGLQKVMAATVLFSPYLPMLFMGEEYGETNPFQYFVSHSSEELITAVREGRKKEFAAFDDGSDVPDPQSEKTFNDSRLSWEKLLVPGHQKMLHFYKELIRLRKTIGALNNCNKHTLWVGIHQHDNTMVLHRWDGKQEIIAVFNFSHQDQKVTVKNITTSWHLLLNSSNVQWGGDDAGEVVPGMNIQIAKESVLLFTNGL